MIIFMAIPERTAVTNPRMTSEISTNANYSERCRWTYLGFNAKTAKKV
jgi:hypothetical protein